LVLVPALHNMGNIVTGYDMQIQVMTCQNL